MSRNWCSRVEITGPFAMSRRLAALFRLLGALCVASFLAAGTSNGAPDTPAVKPVEKKEPAHQVPAEMVEKLLKEGSAEKSGADGKPATDATMTGRSLIPIRKRQGRGKALIPRRKNLSLTMRLK